MTKSEKARQFHKEGYNCAQAVYMAFCEDYGVSLDLGAKQAISFGGGMGGMRETCGALSGAFMVLGLVSNAKQPPSPQEKQAHYEAVREFAQYFQDENGSMICRELLASEKKPCGDLVMLTASMLENFLLKSETVNQS